MVIDLKKKFLGPVEVRERFDLGGRIQAPEIERIEAVEAEFEVARLGQDRYRLQGSWRTSVQAVCDRCLASYAVPLGAGFALTYFPESQRTQDQAREAEMRLEEVDVAYYRDDRLEVLPMLEEQVNLAMPMHWVCAESCRGLCPGCGVDLNRAACSCSLTVSGDPRLEVLKSLRALRNG